MPIGHPHALRSHGPALPTGLSATPGLVTPAAPNAGTDKNIVEYRILKLLNEHGCEATFIILLFAKYSK